MDKDQVVEGILTDKSSEQSEKSDEPITLEGVAQLAKGLQKGYTQTRQDIAEFNEKLDKLTETFNEKSGAQPGEDEYLTTGKLKEILTNERQADIERQQRAEQYIDSAVVDLKGVGVIKDDNEAKELMNFAIAQKETNLYRAAAAWQTQKATRAKDDATKEAAEVKARQAEGMQVGTSSTNTEGESMGVDYAQVVRNRYR